MPIFTVTRHCIVCGSEFKITPADLRRGRGSFCSHPCSANHRRRPLAERFWSRVDKSGDCWLWLGYRMPGGYGQIRVSKPSQQMELTHRVAWEITYGTIPEGLEVHHVICDNPP